jgi:broad specificity phosphatase PhoE
MDAPVARLICLRHGESANVINRQAGALPGAPLTARGRDQAAAAAARLHDQHAGTVYASSAIRSRQTAAIIASALGLEVAVLPGLSEVGLGSKEGATDPATRRLVAQVLRAWIVDGDLSARVADGESGHDVAARVTAALTRIATASTGQPAIVIGHVASLTTGISALCRNGPVLWGAPLPHAVPFPLTRRGPRWHVQWPAKER